MVSVWTFRKPLLYPSELRGRVYDFGKPQGRHYVCVLTAHGAFCACYYITKIVDGLPATRNETQRCAIRRSAEECG
jgi:hypothetical protein